MAPAAAAKEPATASAPAKPIQSFRLRGVSIAVFPHQAKVVGNRTVTFHNAAISKSYKDDDGTWHTTSNFNRDDLPVLAMLANQAWKFILETESARGTEASGEE